MFRILTFVAIFGMTTGAVINVDRDLKLITEHAKTDEPIRVDEKVVDYIDNAKKTGEHIQGDWEEERSTENLEKTGEPIEVDRKEVIYTETAEKTGEPIQGDWEEVRYTAKAEKTGEPIQDDRKEVIYTENADKTPGLLTEEAQMESEEMNAIIAQDFLAYRNNVLKLARLRPHTRDLSNDMEEFLALIDLEQVMVAILEHIQDPEVLDVVVFILSPEFKDMVLEFEAMPEFTEALVYLKSRGYDLTPAINSVHELLSLPPLPRADRRDISSLLEAIVGALPADRLKAFFQQKLLTSPEFAELYSTLTSREFQDIVQRMSRSDTFLKAKEILEGMGFDFEYIEELFEDMFQINYAFN